MKNLQRNQYIDEDVAPPRPRLVTSTPSAVSTQRREPEDHELRVSFSELTLIYKSLQAVKALGALHPQDELLNDTIQLVDQALERAV